MKCVYWLLIAWFVLTACRRNEGQWKDEWLLNWQRHALELNTMPCFDKNCSLTLPMYVPARQKANYSQVIPKAIWQTWKSLEAAGPNHYRSIMSFIRDNPEYEYYMFDDQAALDFMCTFYADHSLIYQQVVPGAVQADLWRLAVIYRYGGVYFDTDSQSKVPLRSIIWQNASVVSGIGSLGDFHQWALIYRQRHPIVKAALKTALRRLKDLHARKSGGNMVSVTGPGALHTAVKEVFQSANCIMYSRPNLRYEPNTTLQIRQSTQCRRTMGTMQVYVADFLGENVHFKIHATDVEKNKVSLYYGKVERDFNTLFQFVGVHEMGHGTFQVGQCVIDQYTKMQQTKMDVRRKQLSLWNTGRALIAVP